MKFFKLFSQLPFSGKFVISKELFEVYVATSHEDRRKEYRDALILLVIMIAAHLVQAWMGYEALTSDAPLYAKAYFLLYGLVNVTVSLTQLWLLWRVTIFHFTRPIATRQHYRVRPKPEQIMLAAAFTLAGQSVFWVLNSMSH